MSWSSDLAALIGGAALGSAGPGAVAGYFGGNVAGQQARVAQEQAQQRINTEQAQQQALANYWQGSLAHNQQEEQDRVIAADDVVLTDPNKQADLGLSNPDSLGTFIDTANQRRRERGLPQWDKGALLSRYHPAAASPPAAPHPTAPPAAGPPPTAAPPVAAPGSPTPGKIPSFYSPYTQPGQEITRALGAGFGTPITGPGSVAVPGGSNNPPPTAPGTVPIVFTQGENGPEVRLRPSVASGPPAPGQTQLLAPTPGSPGAPPTIVPDTSLLSRPPVVPGTAPELFGLGSPSTPAAVPSVGTPPAPVGTPAAPGTPAATPSVPSAPRVIDVPGVGQIQIPQSFDSWNNFDFNSRVDYWRSQGYTPATAMAMANLEQKELEDRVTGDMGISKFPLIMQQQILDIAKTKAETTEAKARAGQADANAAFIRGSKTNYTNAGTHLRDEQAEAVPQNLWAKYYSLGQKDRGLAQRDRAQDDLNAFREVETQIQNGRLDARNQSNAQRMVAIEGRFGQLQGTLTPEERQRYQKDMVLAKRWSIGAFGMRVPFGTGQDALDDAESILNGANGKPGFPAQPGGNPSAPIQFTPTGKAPAGGGFNPQNITWNDPSQLAKISQMDPTRVNRAVGVITAGKFNKFMKALPANDPDRMNAKTIYRGLTGQDWTGK